MITIKDIKPYEFNVKNHPELQNNDWIKYMATWFDCLGS